MVSKGDTLLWMNDYTEGLKANLSSSFFIIVIVNAIYFLIIEGFGKELFSLNKIRLED